MKRIYANEPTRWTRYVPSLMDSLTRTKRASPRQKGRRTNHLFDWMAHASNLAKGSPTNLRADKSRCQFCNLRETQHHINVACLHPPMVEMRKSLRRKIDEFFQAYRHQPLPQHSRWIIPIIDYIEDQVWQDTEAGGDIWNGRWTRFTLHDLLPDGRDLFIPSREYKITLGWLQRLTALLQHAQRTLYRVRRTELLSKERQSRNAYVISLRRKRHTKRTQTLFEAWRIPYVRTDTPRRRPNKATLPPTPTVTPPTILPLIQWMQYSSALPKKVNSTTSINPHVHTKPVITTNRETHRSTKLKLRKLRNIILLCR